MGVILRKAEARRGKVPRPGSGGGFAGRLRLRRPVPGSPLSQPALRGAEIQGSPGAPDEAVAPSLQAPQGASSRPPQTKRRNSLLVGRLSRRGAVSRGTPGPSVGGSRVHAALPGAGRLREVGAPRLGPLVPLSPGCKFPGASSVEALLSSPALQTPPRPRLSPPTASPAATKTPQPWTAGRRAWTSSRTSWPWRPGS